MERPCGMLFAAVVAELLLVVAAAGTAYRGLVPRSLFRCLAIFAPVHRFPVRHCTLSLTLAVLKHLGLR